jgi:hypothetical protein
MRLSLSLLRAIWVALGLAACFASSGRAATLFENTNTQAVTGCTVPFPACQPIFPLPNATITGINTYHRAGAAAAGKTITLQMVNAGPTGTGVTNIATFQVNVAPASAGFENWLAIIPGGAQAVVAGQYTILDSEPDTWQRNGASGDKGFVIVTGSVGSATAAAGSITDCTATCALSPNVLAEPSPPPVFACSAHGPRSTCTAVSPTAESPGTNVMCTDGVNTTTCNCRTGCTTR